MFGCNRKNTWVCSVFWCGKVTASMIAENVWSHTSCVCLFALVQEVSYCSTVMCVLVCALCSGIRQFVTCSPSSLHYSPAYGLCSTLNRIESLMRMIALLAMLPHHWLFASCQTVGVDGAVLSKSCLLVTNIFHGWCALAVRLIYMLWENLFLSEKTSSYKFCLLSLSLSLSLHDWLCILSFLTHSLFTWFTCLCYLFLKVNQVSSVLLDFLPFFQVWYKPTNHSAPRRQL